MLSVDRVKIECEFTLKRVRDMTRTYSQVLSCLRYIYFNEPLIFHINMKLLFCRETALINPSCQTNCLACL